MTQIIESVLFGVVTEEAIDCPFEHKKHDCKGASFANTVSGNSKTLGENLKKPGKDGSTVVRRDEAPFSDAVTSKEDVYECMPSVVPVGKPSDWANWVQLTPGNENTWYPVLFQAHHLIPGDGSLKVAPQFRKYIDTEIEGSVVCCNLGYDVDGKENGLWLPGKSAVAQGKLGVVKLWGGSARGLPDKEYADTNTVGRREKGESRAEDFVPLKGDTPSKGSKAPLGDVFHPYNRKWLYVQAATELASPKRQFHDSHMPYNGKVKEHLTAIGAILDRFRKPGAEFACKKCSIKPNTKVPASPKLLLVLRELSSELRSRLINKTSNSIYYTSEWSNANNIAKGLAQSSVND